MKEGKGGEGQKKRKGEVGTVSSRITSGKTDCKSALDGMPDTTA